jgi:ATP-dependent RNA helicase DOB1
VAIHPIAHPQLEPIEDMQLKDEAVVIVVQRLGVLLGRLTAHELHNSPERTVSLQRLAQRKELVQKIAFVTGQIEESKSVVDGQELRGMKRCLRRLGFVQDGVITKKGRAACEVSSGDELLIAEMMFDGMFNDMTEDYIVAILSCFVHQEKVKEDGKVANPVPDELAMFYQKMLEVAKRVGRVKEECGVLLSESGADGNNSSSNNNNNSASAMFSMSSEDRIEFYAKNFTPSLMRVCYDWARGDKFKDIIQKTTVYEGSIIRAIRRLNELLLQLKSASISLGDDSLASKFDACSEKITRDIVFANSLYL